jgi:hypothetical protein
MAERAAVHAKSNLVRQSSDTTMHRCFVVTHRPNWSHIVQRHPTNIVVYVKISQRVHTLKNRSPRWA